VVVVVATLTAELMFEEEDDAEEDGGGGVAKDISTGFLERFLPRCMCFSQYLESGYASLEHRHFLPSVRRHRPGSGSSALRPKPIPKQPQPTANTISKYVSNCYVEWYGKKTSR
jgi:hypothetical protein